MFMLDRGVDVVRFSPEVEMVQVFFIRNFQYSKLHLVTSSTLRQRIAEFMDHSLHTLLIGILGIALAGCGGSSVLYNTGIESVERPTDAEERYGEYTVSERDTTEGTKFVYEDDLVRAGWVYAGGSMLLILRNKTEHSIQARLEQGAFVMPGGSSQRILTGDMSYANRNDEVRPITVPSRASSSAILIPEDKIGFNEYSGVTIDGIFEPTSLEPGTQAKPSDVEANLGETFSILLPLEIQGTVNEYTFNFEVLGAKIEGGPNTDTQTFGQYPSN